MFVQFLAVESFLLKGATLKHICETLLRNKFERNYMERILKDNFNMKPGVKTERFQYPEIIKITVENQNTEKIITTGTIGKPYVFLADKFLNETELSHFELSAEAEFLGQAGKAPDYITNRGKQLQLTPTEPTETLTDLIR